MSLHSNLLAADIHIGPNINKAGVLVGARRTLNLIEGSNTTLTVSDNSGTDSVDITINSAGGGSGLTVAQVRNLISMRVG